jgi:hypothetical protein
MTRLKLLAAEAVGLLPGKVELARWPSPGTVRYRPDNLATATCTAWPFRG